MKKSLILKKVATVAICTSLIFSCTKKDETVPTPTPTPSGGSNTPGTTVVGADGVLVGIRSQVNTNYTIGGFPINTTVYTEMASASINSSSTSSTLVDAGAITLNDTVLTKQANNSYYYASNNTTSMNGFTNFFNNGTNWKVAGNGAVTAFNASVSTFPSVAPLNLTNTTVDKSKAYTITLSYAPSNCDSIVFQIVGEGTVLTSSAKSSFTTSHTFTSAEMATLKSSVSSAGVPTGQVSVFTYKYGNKTVASKKYWMINISTKTYSVNVQ